MLTPKKNVLNSGQIKSIRKQQLQEITELRGRMKCILQDKNPITLLSVGEGVEWDATWIGFCILNEAIPSNVKLIVLVDLKSHGSNSFFEYPLLRERNDFFILPVYSDGTRLPFSANCYDMSISSLMIDDCEDHFGLLSELYRCTRSGGMIMVSGHGIDLVGELSNIKGLVGSKHKYPCLPEKFDNHLNCFNIKVHLKWQNYHTWLRVFEKVAY